MAKVETAAPKKSYVTATEDKNTGKVTLVFDVKGYREMCEIAGVPTWGGEGTRYPLAYNIYLPANLPSCLIHNSRGFSILADDLPVMTLAEALEALGKDEITIDQYKAIKAQYSK